MWLCLLCAVLWAVFGMEPPVSGCSAWSSLTSLVSLASQHFAAAPGRLLAVTKTLSGGQSSSTTII